MSSNGNIGIIISGGPAPGINSVIASIVIEALEFGFNVKGIKNGFQGACSKNNNSFIDLSVDMVTPHTMNGGSILGTSRFNPFSTQQLQETFIQCLHEQNIDKLIVVGGEGSAFLSYQISLLCSEIKVVHIPKTIDNDLVLPHHHPSFGFETARYAGANILSTLSMDARTTSRWFIVTTMGRKAGFLALGLGIASGATLTLIPEEFEDRMTTLEELSEIIFESMRKRARIGKPFGIVLLAEGIIEKLTPASLCALNNSPRDDLGRIKYSEIALEEYIRDSLRKHCRQEQLNIQMTTKNIGYELRCYPPISFDIEFTKFLGYGAVKYLAEGRSGIMIVRDFDNVRSVPLADLIDGQRHIISRKVDLKSDLYTVARSFMIR